MVLGPGQVQFQLLADEWFPLFLNTNKINKINRWCSNLKIHVWTRGPWATSLTWENENLLVLRLNKLEFPSSKDALCQVWLNLAQWFWRRFFNFVNVFSLFHNYLSLEKGWDLHLNKVESLSPKDALCPVKWELAQWFWRRFFNFTIS